MTVCTCVCACVSFIHSICSQLESFGWVDCDCAQIRWTCHLWYWHIKTHKNYESDTHLSYLMHPTEKKKDTKTNENKTINKFHFERVFNTFTWCCFGFADPQTDRWVRSGFVLSFRFAFNAWCANLLRILEWTNDIPHPIMKSSV